MLSLYVLFDVSLNKLLNKKFHPTALLWGVITYCLSKGEILAYRASFSDEEKSNGCWIEELHFKSMMAVLWIS